MLGRNPLVVAITHLDSVLSLESDSKKSLDNAMRSPGASLTQKDSTTGLAPLESAITLKKYHAIQWLALQPSFWLAQRDIDKISQAFREAIENGDVLMLEAVFSFQSKEALVHQLVNIVHNENSLGFEAQQALARGDHNVWAVLLRNSSIRDRLGYYRFWDITQQKYPNYKGSPLWALLHMASPFIEQLSTETLKRDTLFKVIMSAAPSASIVKGDEKVNSEFLRCVRLLIGLDFSLETAVKLYPDLNFAPASFIYDVIKAATQKDDTAPIEKLVKVGFRLQAKHLDHVANLRKINLFKYILASFGERSKVAVERVFKFGDNKSDAIRDRITAYASAITKSDPELANQEDQADAFELLHNIAEAQQIKLAEEKVAEELRLREEQAKQIQNQKIQKEKAELDKIKKEQINPVSIEIVRTAKDGTFTESEIKSNLDTILFSQKEKKVGADALNSKGETPLMVAIDCQNIAAIRWLLGLKTTGNLFARSRLRDIGLLHRDNSGKSIFDHLALCEDQEKRSAMLDCLLVDSKALNARIGQYPILEACKLKALQLERLFRAKQASFDEVQKDFLSVIAQLETLKTQDNKKELGVAYASILRSMGEVVDIDRKRNPDTTSDEPSDTSAPSAPIPEAKSDSPRDTSAPSAPFLPRDARLNSPRDTSAPSAPPRLDEEKPEFPRFFPQSGASDRPPQAVNSSAVVINDEYQPEGVAPSALQFDDYQPEGEEQNNGAGEPGYLGGDDDNGPGFVGGEESDADEELNQNPGEGASVRVRRNSFFARQFQGSDQQVNPPGSSAFQKRN